MNPKTRQRRRSAATSAMRMTSAGMNGMSPIAEPTYEASLSDGVRLRGEPVVDGLVGVPDRVDRQDDVDEQEAERRSSRPRAAA